MNATPISVFLVDDHALVRRSVGECLDRETDITVVGEAGAAHEAVAAVARLLPSIVLMDIDMPGQSCFEAAHAIKQKSPDTRVIFLSAFFHDRYIEQALKVQALGYLTKGEPPEAVITAVRAVAAGEVYYSPEVLERVVVDDHGVRLVEAGQSRISLLTRREVEVLQQIARGHSKKEIAALLHLSVKTVQNHTHSLMIKLGIHDRVHLARFAIREGLAEA